VVAAESAIKGGEAESGKTRHYFTVPIFDYN
jgi:hypothetical protein